ncbi:MAG: M48 family metalloprotease [Reinekea sp.]
MKFSAIVLFTVAPHLFAADFGAQKYGWSETASRDFQDYYIRTLNKKSAIINDFWLHYWLQQELLKLNIRSPNPVGLTETVILKDSTINAYALPGNIIAIYAGLIQTSASEDELASVLAHEMSHIALDHFTRITQNSESQALKILAGMALAVVLAQESSEAANAALFSTLASTQQNRLNFSQGMEVEADQLAQQILQQTDYDDGAGARFFLKLYAEHGGQEAYEYLRSHPLGTTRASKLAGKASGDEQPPSTFYRFMKAYLSYLKNGKFNAVNFSMHEEKLNDPDWQFAIWMNQHLKSSLTPDITALQKLIRQYPSYLPAQFALLKYSANESDRYCEQLQGFEQQLGKRSITLDVLDLLAEQSSKCISVSAVQWQAQRYWQSGKEKQAIAYLNQQISQSPDTNQTARLNNQLELYTRRYDRFR